MRIQTVLLGLAFLATAASAIPVQVTLVGEAAGAIGPLSFTLDLDEQPRSPYDYPDINEFSGDYLFKQEDYRINIADYFQVDMGGWSGYGFNWLLERYPSGLGIFEEYCEVRMFRSPGETLILTGAWATTWSEDTPLFASLESQGEETRREDYRIAGLVERPHAVVPEPSSLVLFGSGFLAFAGFGAFRNRRAKP